MMSPNSAVALAAAPALHVRSFPGTSFNSSKNFPSVPVSEEVICKPWAVTEEAMSAAQISDPKILFRQLDTRAGMLATS
jgi:hypothetical protein